MKITLEIRNSTGGLSLDYGSRLALAISHAQWVAGEFIGCTARVVNDRQRVYADFHSWADESIYGETLTNQRRD